MIVCYGPITAGVGKGAVPESVQTALGGDVQGPGAHDGEADEGKDASAEEV